MSTAHGAVSKDYLPFQNALASLLLDEEQGRMVCDVILGRSVGSHSSVAATEELAAFFPSCSVPRTYAAVIHNWISTQMQPLLSYRPHHSFPSGTSSRSSCGGGAGGMTRIVSASRTSVNIGSKGQIITHGSSIAAADTFTSQRIIEATTNSYDNKVITSNTFAGLPIVSKSKQKKRMTPIVVSADSNSISNVASSGNISVLPSSNGIDMSICSMQGHLKKMSVNTISSQDGGGGGKSDLNISSISNVSSSSNSNIQPSAPRTVASIALSRKAANEHPYIVEPIPQSLSGGNLGPGVASIVASKDGRERLARQLGNVYGSLVMRQLVSLSHSLPLVMKAAAVSIGDGNYVKTLNNSTFFSILVDDFSLKTFFLAVVSVIMPVLKSLGNSVLESLLKLDVLRRPNGCTVAQSIRDELQSCYEDNKVLLGTEEEESGMLLQTDTTFIRCFREEVDSRYEYKSPLECYIYNEREQLFDMFSNLFRQFQEMDRSDLDGSKVSDFIRFSLPAVKPRILSMKDINLVWFVGIFRDLTMFYGVNNNHAEASANGVGASRQQMLESRMGYPSQPTMPSQGSRATSSGASNASSVTAEDIYSEQAAVFPGNQQFFFRFILMIDSTRFSQHLEVALHSAINNLVDSGSDINIRKATNEEKGDADVQSTAISTDSYTLRVLKLKLLGKYLGVLKFSSFWSLSSGVNPAGPLHLLLREEARARCGARMHNGALSAAHDALQAAILAKKTSLAVSWVVEFIKMSYWDVTWDLVANADNGSMQHNIFSDVLAALKKIQRDHSASLYSFGDANSNKSSSDIAISNATGSISANRLFTLVEIQNLFLSLPVSTSVRSALINDAGSVHHLWKEADSPIDKRSGSNRSNSYTVPGSVKSVNSPVENGANGSTSSKAFIDSNNDAFSPLFIRHVMPFLDQLLKMLSSSSNVGSTVTTHRSSKSSNVRRQTPNVITSSAAGYPSTFNSFGSGATTTASGLTSANVSYSGTPLSSKKTDKGSTANGSKLSLSSPSGAGKSRSGGGGSGQLTFYMPSPTTPSINRRAASQPKGSKAQRHLEHDIHHKLEMSFWQQHVNLFSINVFVLDNLRNASLAHLKDKVAEAIHELWGTAAALKTDVEEEMATESNVTSAITTSRNGSFVAKFQSALSDFERRLHANTLQDGLSFLQEFNSNHLSATLPDLCTLYPCHGRVAEAAVRFISKRAGQQQQGLLDYLDSYSARKFSEVISISVSQFQKALDGKELQYRKATGSSSNLVHATALTSNEHYPRQEILMAKLFRMHSEDFSRIDLQVSSSLLSPLYHPYCSLYYTHNIRRAGRQPL